MTDSLPDTHINSTFLDQQKVDFAYAIFWTKIARQWQPDYCAMVQSPLDTLFQSVDFQNNPFKRQYAMPVLAGVPTLRSQHYAGASLLALAKVLAAFQRLNETNA